MDEPTNHLDLISKDVLKQALSQYDGTLILVSHDRNFLHSLVKDIYELKPNGLKHFVGDIYDFLKEKKTHSIAAFEQAKQQKQKQKIAQAKPAQSDKSNTQNQALSYAERKERDKELRKVKNKVSRTVKEIEETEASIAALNLILAELDYSDTDKSQAKLDEFEGLKSHLDWLVSEWEAAELKLEKLSD